MAKISNNSCILTDRWFDLVKYPASVFTYHSNVETVQQHPGKGTFWGFNKYAGLYEYLLYRQTEYT